MNRIQVWTQAVRPKTLILIICPIIIGLTLALSTGHFDPPVFLFTLLTGLGIQISTNLANDYFDFIKGADTSDRKGPLRVTQAGLVPAPTMKKVFLCTILLTAFAGCYLVWHGGFVIACLLALSLLLGVIYTGGPFPLAYLGLGDFFVFIFFGPIAVLFTYFLQTHQFSMDAALAGIAPGALSSAVLMVNNLRDVEEDRLANKKTLVVRLGKTFGKTQYILALLTVMATPFLLLENHHFCLLATLVGLPAIPVAKTVLTSKDPDVLNQGLAKTAQLLFIYTLLFCLGWMI